MIVPETVLVGFFESAETQLTKLDLGSPSESAPSPSIAAIRRRLLSTQMECLTRVVHEHNLLQSTGVQITVDQVQMRLKEINATPISSQTKICMDQMNEAARLAFARLVLHAECARVAGSTDVERHEFKAGPMSRPDLLEFIGLCTVAVRLPNVKHHLSRGSPLFADLPSTANKTAFFPQERLESIQRLLLRAIGYDPDYGSAEVKRLLFSSDISNQEADKELTRLVIELETAMIAAIRNATEQAMFDNGLSDVEQGGTTRVVKVDYSEHIIDALSGEVIASHVSDSNNQQLPPRSQGMEDFRTQEGQAERERHRTMAKQTSRLQQEILGELLSMDPEEREVKLEESTNALQLLSSQLTDLSARSDLVSAVQDLDMPTQRLIIMGRIWESLLLANGGSPPTIQKQQQPEE